jgi:hypothetical protein
MLSIPATETIATGNQIQNYFLASGLCFCNLLFETNNFRLGVILLLCLFSELRETPSPRIEIRTLYPEF